MNTDQQKHLHRQTDIVLSVKSFRFTKPKAFWKSYLSQACWGCRSHWSKVLSSFARLWTPINARYASLCLDRTYNCLRRSLQPWSSGTWWINTSGNWCRNVAGKFSIGGLCVSAGVLWVCAVSLTLQKLTKTQLIYSVSCFNLRGLELCLWPKPPPWRRDWTDGCPAEGSL